MPRRSPDSGVDGVLCIDKPAGWTSHDVVAKVRRLSGQRRIGHGGTLDPAATGLLVLLLGKATRLAEYVSTGRKTYDGVIQLGLRTTTDDMEGEVVSRAPVAELTPESIEQLRTAFTGALEQVPPAYSAVHVEGRRAHELARRGETLELRSRPVTIHHLRIEPLTDDQLAITVACSAGTYIRSLARDIGDVLGCGGALASLRRTASGALHVEDAITIEQVATLAEAGKLESRLLPSDEAALSLPAAILAPEQAERLRAGSKLEGYPDPGEGTVLRLYDTLGAFFGIGSVRESLLTPHKVLAARATPEAGQQ